MRDYAKISPRFWFGKTGRQIRQKGVDTQLVALHLMSCPHATMMGVYYLPVNLIAHETGMSLRRAQQALANLCELEFCSYDAEMEYVFVHEMAFYQVGALKAGDNRIKALNEDYHALPAELNFLDAFYERYHTIFHLEQKVAPQKAPSKELPRASEGASKGLERGFEAPSKALRSQEQEQEQKQEQEQEQENKAIVAPARPPASEHVPCKVLTVFNHWRTTMQHPHAVLDAKRRGLISSALKTYTPEQLCQAITGCAFTPHNIGQNDRGERYDGLHVILRNAEQIERFMRNAQSPPKPQDKLWQQNIQAGQRWLERHAHPPPEPATYHADATMEVHHASP